MKRRRLALLTAGAIALVPLPAIATDTPAIDERIQQIYDHIEAYQRVALNEYNVPAWQALPPASAPHLAFRPACRQLTWQQFEGEHVWHWEGELIYRSPDAVDIAAAGICKRGESHAVEVPKVLTADVWSQFESAIAAGGRAVAVLPDTEVVEVVEVVDEQPQQPQETVSTTAQPSTGSRQSFPFIWVVLGIVAAAGLGWSLRKGDNRKRISKPPTAITESPQEPPQESTEIVYDFEL